jgi:hypothetical protein
MNDLDYMINEINCQQVKKLKRTKNSTKVIKVKINSLTKNHLVNTYNLNGRYKQSIRFLEDFSLITRRYMQINSYCYVKEPTFQMRISNNRKINFSELENGVLVKRTCLEGPSVSIKFDCGYHVELSDELRKWCESI